MPGPRVDNSRGCDDSKDFHDNTFLLFSETFGSWIHCACEIHCIRPFLVLQHNYFDQVRCYEVLEDTDIIASVPLNECIVDGMR